MNRIKVLVINIKMVTTVIMSSMIRLMMLAMNTCTMVGRGWRTLQADPRLTTKPDGGDDGDGDGGSAGGDDGDDDNVNDTRKNLF